MSSWGGGVQYALASAGVCRDPEQYVLPYAMPSGVSREPAKVARRGIKARNVRDGSVYNGFGEDAEA
jgi:hypothetical protein